MKMKRASRERLLALGVENADAARQIAAHGLGAACRVVDTMAGVYQRGGVAKSLMAAVRRAGEIPACRIIDGREEVPLLTWQFRGSEQVGMVRWAAVSRK